jgi:serine/threonine protein kinase
LEIHEKIGDGTFGVIYRGRKSDIPENIAVKVIPRSRIDRNPHISKLLETERQALSKLHHEHVIRLLDVFSTQSEIN